MNYAFITARAGLAAIFLISGWGKLAAVEGTAAYVAGAGLPFPTLVVLGAAALELGAGLALLVGWNTRLAAGALALFTLMAAVRFHADFGDENQAIHFWKNVAIAGGLAHLALFEWVRTPREAPSALPLA
jgi:putative oxidoreductase